MDGVREIRFTKEHEWILIQDDLAIIGITDFAQKQLGDIVSIELPKIGDKFKQMQPMAIVDSIKASSDIFCPLDGEIVKINEELLEHPELINQSPFESGWIVKMRPLNIKQFDELMKKEQYEKFVAESQ